VFAGGEHQVVGKGQRQQRCRRRVRPSSRAVQEIFGTPPIVAAVAADRRRSARYIVQPVAFSFDGRPGPRSTGRGRPANASVSTIRAAPCAAMPRTNSGTQPQPLPTAYSRPLATGT
jgi:hypothetical protein